VPGTDSIRHPLTRTLLALTVITGVVDAAAYLGLGHVFAANMTGNVLLLGFGIAGAGGLSAAGPLVSIGAFALGGVAGGRVVAAVPGGRLLGRSMAIEAGLFGLATLLAIVFDVTPEHFSGYLVVAVLAFAMGLRNAAVRRLGVPDISTVVLTMTLTALTADSPFGGGSGEGSSRRGSVVAAMLAGAVLGALLVKSDLVLVLLATVVLALATALLLVPAVRSTAE
jgi:uncharacterized membrane protein YoaK (UPF0700 family)